MKSILSSSQNTLELLQSVHQGINDSLALFKTISPETYAGLYSDWQKGDQGLQSIYGTPPSSKETKIQQDADQSASEAILLNNSIYNYTQQIDEIGERVKAHSHVASPEGAQKLTAEALGVILHVLNQSLRAQATGLKLQAQTLAIQNHKDKEETRQLLSDTNSLNVAMKSEPVNFTIPRF